jgi:pSer/pThr/pTyr-binding forkhead associated (FHA) protein
MSAMWILQGTGKQTGPFTFRVRSGGVKTVGRATRADFVVDAALVSRLHCRLEAGDEGVDVIDLDSTNGTFVNDRRIERARLTAGDRLRIGRVELTIERSGARTIES